MRDARKLERLLLPSEMGKRRVSLLEKLRERRARREKCQRAQSFGGGLRFVVPPRRTEFPQQIEGVRQHLLVTFMQKIFENLPADLQRYDDRAGHGMKTQETGSE